MRCGYCIMTSLVLFDLQILPFAALMSLSMYHAWACLISLAVFPLAVATSVGLRMPLPEAAAPDCWPQVQGRGAICQPWRPCGGCC